MIFFGKELTHDQVFKLLIVDSCIGTKILNRKKFLVRFV